MDSLKNRIKKVTPPFAWNLIRKAYFSVLQIKDSIGPVERTLNYEGMRLHYRKGNSLIKRLKREDVFERELCEEILRELSSSSEPIFLDVGANIGLISLFVASHAKNVKIYAFEPGISQYGLFCATLKDNNLKHIIPHNKALGDKNGMATFHVHDPNDSALDGFHDTLRRGKTKAIEVPMITLDSWWLSQGKPNIPVVKIDTEGAELMVLRGAHNFIAEIKPVVFLEIEPSNLRMYPYSEKDIFDFFIESGYRVSSLTKDMYKAEPLIDDK